MNRIINVEYKNWLYDLKKRYKSSQIKAAVKVNSELLKFYWSLGKDIVSKQYESKWGSGFFINLSKDLKIEIPDAKGLSVTNLKYMKYYYELFSKEIEIRPQLVDELSMIPWGHIRFIIDSCKSDSKKALFYVEKTIENNWSRAVLLNFLDTDLYERQGKAITNFSETLPTVQGELAQQLTKDPYSFDFLTLSEKYEASYLGQLGLYVSSVNHLLKKEYDNSTIGLLICKSKDDIVAKYALETSTVPIGISEYELQKIFPKEFKSSLPSIEEIEEELK